jgi:anti-sigma B factor antagonist
MDIWENRQGTVIILKVHGKLDAATSPLFEEKILPMLEKGEKNFLIDFGSLDYISSAALRRLLVLARGANKAGGKVVLVSLQSHIREIFDMAGFTQLFPMYASPEEAMRSF